MGVTVVFVQGLIVRRLGTLITATLLAAGCAADTGQVATDGDLATTTTAVTTTSSVAVAPSSRTTLPPTTTSVDPTTTTVPAAPPKLEIVDPEPGAAIRTPSYVFRGVTDPGCTVDVGDRYFADVDDDGNWSLELMLRRGENATTFTATDPSGATTVVQIRVEQRPPLADAVVGEWVGTMDSPWISIPDVWFHFRADGTYSVRNRALYWGDDFDTPNKTYAVWERDDPETAAIQGDGRIAITWGDDTHRDAHLSQVALEDDRLHLELWDRGYGPIQYELEPSPQGYCIDDYWEGEDRFSGANHGRPLSMPGSGEPSQLSFDGVVCPGDSDLHHLYVWILPGHVPVGEEIEITQRATVTSHGDGDTPIEMILYADQSNWVGTEYARVTIQPGETGTLEYVSTEFHELPETHVHFSWSLGIESDGGARHSYTATFEVLTG